MATKTRVPNKVIWGLEDIQAQILRGRRAWQAAFKRAEDRFPDPALLVALAELRDVLATIETKTVDARNGNYRE